VDVVALTGDCVSQTSKQVPPGWDAWPQKLKVSVPGNHDHPDTFDLLRTWRHQAPWVCRLDDLVFVGLDSPLPDRVEKNLRGVDLEGARGIVLLFHERPRIEEDRLADVLRGFVGSREMLILHGHEHPASFKGAEWDQSGRLGGKSYFRSKVCSSVSSRRGLGHLIWWDKHSFRCEVVQGPETPLMWLNPKAVHTTWVRGRW